MLFAVVFLAELKQLDWKYGAIGLLVLGLVLGLAVAQYRKKRLGEGPSGTSPASGPTRSETRA